MITTKNKAGRPRARVQRKKGLTISISEEEERIIIKKAENSHLNRAQYIYMTLGKMGVFDEDKKLSWE